MSRMLPLFLFLALAIGCTPAAKQPTVAEKKDPAKETPIDLEDAAKIAAARAKLSPEDLVLVLAQEWCAVQNESRLGSMGVPQKLMIKDQPVFICCGHCKKRAEADPEKTLAKLEELKAKAKK